MNLYWLFRPKGVFGSVSYRELRDAEKNSTQISKNKHWITEYDFPNKNTAISKRKKCAGIVLFSLDFVNEKDTGQEIKGVYVSLLLSEFSSFHLSLHIISLYIIHMQHYRSLTYFVCYVSLLI